MKDKVKIPLDEQELTISYYPIEDNKNCQVYTTIPTMMKYLERLVNKHPDICTVVDDDQYSYTVSMPFKLCKPHGPRNISAAVKEAGAKRLAEARERKLAAILREEYTNTTDD